MPSGTTLIFSTESVNNCKEIFQAECSINVVNSRVNLNKNMNDSDVCKMSDVTDMNNYAQDGTVLSSGGSDGKQRQGPNNR